VANRIFEISMTDVDLLRWHRHHQLDQFGRNPLAVIEDGSALSDEEMQLYSSSILNERVAKETGAPF